MAQIDLFCSRMQKAYVVFDNGTLLIFKKDLKRIQKAIPRLKEYFKSVLLPELITRRIAIKINAKQQAEGRNRIL